MNLKIPVSILFIFLLIVTLSQPVAGEDTLDQETIEVQISIETRLDVNIPEEDMELDLENEELDLTFDGEGDIQNVAGDAEGLEEDDFSTSMEFSTFANRPMSLSVNSTIDFGEGMNEYFQYRIKNGGEEEQVVSISPGEELAPGRLQQESGLQLWELELAMEEETARQWQTWNDLDQDELTELGDEWTELAAGEYEDELIITFHPGD